MRRILCTAMAILAAAATGCQALDYMHCTSNGVVTWPTNLAVANGLLTTGAVDGVTIAINSNGQLYATGSATNTPSVSFGGITGSPTNNAALVSWGAGLGGTDGAARANNVLTSNEVAALRSRALTNGGALAGSSLTISGPYSTTMRLHGDDGINVLEITPSGGTAHEITFGNAYVEFGDYEVRNIKAGTISNSAVNLAQMNEAITNFLRLTNAGGGKYYFVLP